jgi:hypothetical protein
MVSYGCFDVEIWKTCDCGLSDMDGVLVIEGIGSGVDQDFSSGFFKIFERRFSLLKKQFSIEVSMSIDQHTGR